MLSPSPAFRLGLTRYRLGRNPRTHVVERVLPADVGIVHALSVHVSESGLQIREPQYLEQRHEREAVCGAKVR
jgi:hypothetical protein